MHISFLLHNAYGIGGTIRTTFNLAETLAQHHEVEIVSVLRHRNRPHLSLDPSVHLRHLVDIRKGTTGYEGDDPEYLRPASFFPQDESRYRQYSALTDRRIAAHLGSIEADAVVATRPGLNVHLARQTRRGPLRIGQEHLTLDTHAPGLLRQLRATYPRLDALTTTTEADARAYRARMRLPGVRIEALANSVPAPGIAPADGSGKWVVAAGRLAPVKRYDLLIRAFARVREVRPDWRLRIYGAGGQEQRLRALVLELGLWNHVHLMGRAAPMEAEWVKGSIAVVTSEMESFGMTIVEAMRAGLPVVATDCPHGPGEIIRDGEDGRLVANKDPEAIAAGLLELIEDDSRRTAMGRAALRNSERFDPQQVGERFEHLLRGLPVRGGGMAGRLRGSLHRGRGALLGSGYALTALARTALLQDRAS